MSIKSGLCRTFSRGVEIAWVQARQGSPQRAGGCGQQLSVPVHIPALWLPEAKPEHPSTYVLSRDPSPRNQPVADPDRDLATGLFCAGMLLALGLGMLGIVGLLR